MTIVAGHHDPKRVANGIQEQRHFVSPFKKWREGSPLLGSRSVPDNSVAAWPGGIFQIITHGSSENISGGVRT